MGKFQDEYKRLNAAQKQAVDVIDGPLLVIAGPGTGKTQLLSMRVANILRSTDANPANILCLTFTEAAARNMRERLSAMIGEPAYHVGIHTFHSFGSEIIQRYPEYFMDEPLVKAVDELGAYELLLDIFHHLPHSNPLRLMLGDEYLHLHSTQMSISWLKQAGIEPDEVTTIYKANKAFVSFAEPLVEPVFAQRPSPKLLPAYEKLLQDLRGYSSPEADTFLADLFIAELSEAVAAVDPAGRYAKSITQWRNKWLIQNHFKVWVLADRRRNKFLQALASVYQKYQTELAKRGWYTFDDMILRNIRALEQHEDLRLTLQEQYQYILVDEYQDTNGAQNKLLELLADSPVNEGRPNLMVVGDDDQAIYRFQGAHMSIMLDFVSHWRDVAQVVLTENYRSGRQLLDLARHVITQGEERLETKLPALSKALTPGLPHQPKATILRPQTTSELDQYQFVAKKIAELVKQGTKPRDIAILAPKHSYLKALVPYLLTQGIPVAYERREHILEQPRIMELLGLAELIQAASAGDWKHVDSLLPTVLAGEYWGLAPREIWELSVEAYQSKKLWLQLMLHHDNKHIQQFAQAITTLAKQAHRQPLDLLLDQFIGNQPIMIEDNKEWRIPYRQYYFSDAQLEKNPQDYFKLLGQLTTVREKLRDYHPGEQLTLKSLLEFITLYRSSRLTLLDTNPHTTSADAVQLMTAYKAKGLEWDTVFVLGCHNDIWGTKVRSSSNSFALPSSLAWIRPARDTSDDRLRLFYVALTRAKNNLYLTCFKQSLSGKTTEPISWLATEHDSLPPLEEVPTPTTQELIATQEIHWGMTPAEQTSLRDTLQPFLDKYQLSATHLNSFLDITKGGPKHFFFTHILHFPEALQPASVYGSAIHDTLHYAHTQLTQTGKLPPLKAIQGIFVSELQNAPLPQTDVVRLLERGHEALSIFYDKRTRDMQPSDKSEYNFRSEGVTIGEARLTGKADVLRTIDGGELCIIDYKTGAPMHNWQGTTAYGQIRAHLYQQQLAFYHLLVKGSAHFKDRQLHCGKLQFVEADEEGDLPVLEFVPSADYVERLQQLITIIWQHVMDLDFPDTRAYSLDLKGIKQFEQDLLDGKI
jgi:DNA helicase-2/ATP-dependent DNA helicase PcrA